MQFTLFNRFIPLMQKRWQGSGLLAILLAASMSAQGAALGKYDHRDGPGGAVEAATNQDKLILLLSGTATCSACAAAVSIINTIPSVRSIVDDAFVFWDCAQDEGCTSHQDYTAGENGYALPLTCLIDPSDPKHYLYRSFGGNSPAALPGVLRLAMMKGSAPVVTNLAAGDAIPAGHYTVRGHTKWTSLDMSGGVLECQLNGTSFRGSITNSTNWSCILSTNQLRAGSNNFQVYFRDRIYNLGRVTAITFTVGAGPVNLPPTVTLKPTALTKAEGQAIRFVATTAGGATSGFQWLFQAGGTSHFTPLVDQTASVLQLPAITGASAGTYQVLVWNVYGTNSASATLAVTAPDTQAPSLAIVSHVDLQVVVTNAVTLAGNATDAGQGDSGIAGVRVNGMSATYGTATGGAVANWSLPISLSVGTNTITVVATDSAHNATTNRLRLILVPAAEHVPPSLRITGPLPNQRWSNAVFVAQGAAADNVGVASVWYQLNSDAWTPAVGTSNWSASGNLVAGANTLRAYAVDGAGNRSPTNSVLCR